MEEKNELNDIILNKGGSAAGNKKNYFGCCNFRSYLNNCCNANEYSYI